MRGLRTFFLIAAVLAAVLCAMPADAAQPLRSGARFLGRNAVVKPVKAVKWLGSKLLPRARRGC